MRTIVCQSIGEDNDDDAQGRDHGMNEREHEPRHEARVVSRRPKAHCLLAMSLAAIKTSVFPEVSGRTSGS